MQARYQATLQPELSEEGSESRMPSQEASGFLKIMTDACLADLTDETDELKLGFI